MSQENGWGLHARGTVAIGRMVPPQSGQMAKSAAVIGRSLLVRLSVRSQMTPVSRTLPGGRHYGAVNMETSRGNRWFCSTEDAEAAGCRASKNFYSKSFGLRNWGALSVRFRKLDDRPLRCALFLLLAAGLLADDRRTACSNLTAFKN